MQTALTFKNHAISTYDRGDGSLWFTAKQSSKMLGYAHVKSVTNLYNANSDEFSPSMTEVIVTVTSGKSKGCGNLRTKPVFSRYVVCICSACWQKPRWQRNFGAGHLI